MQAQVMIQFTSSSQEALIVKLSALTFISLNCLRMPTFPSLLISGMSSNIGVSHAERGSSICKLDVPTHEVGLSMPEFDIEARGVKRCS